jgi:hypothetical protein
MLSIKNCGVRLEQLKPPKPNTTATIFDCPLVASGTTDNDEDSEGRYTVEKKNLLQAISHLDGSLLAQLARYGVDDPIFDPQQSGISSTTTR